jgi:Fe-S-cluster containining protein
MGSRFKCLHSGKCCEKVYTQINLTVGDIIRLAKFLDWPVEKLFNEYYIGLKPFGVSENRFDIELGLTIPCKFRLRRRCKVYEARPLNCRLFPYWILAEHPKERIEAMVDKSYRCVHRVKLDDKTRARYKEYKDKIVEILKQESVVTDELLRKHSLMQSVDLSHCPEYIDLENQIIELKEKYSGVKLEKKIDELRINLVLELINRSGFLNLLPGLVNELKEQELHAPLVPLDKIRNIEAKKES